MESQEVKKRNFPILDLSKLSSGELRIIGISLSVLSLGLALAWIGFVYLSTR